MNAEDPLQNPEPMEELGGTAGYYMLYVIAAAGVLFFSPVSMCLYGTRGGTRSSRIQWEARQAEVQSAIAAEGGTHGE
jgi:hypothetical protein